MDDSLNPTVTPDRPDLLSEIWDEFVAAYRTHGFGELASRHRYILNILQGRLPVPEAVSFEVETRVRDFFHIRTGQDMRRPSSLSHAGVRYHIAVRKAALRERSKILEVILWDVANGAEPRTWTEMEEAEKSRARSILSGNTGDEYLGIVAQILVKHPELHTFREFDDIVSERQEELGLLHLKDPGPSIKKTLRRQLEKRFGYAWKGGFSGFKARMLGLASELETVDEDNQTPEDKRGCPSSGKGDSVS